MVGIHPLRHKKNNHPEMASTKQPRLTEKTMPPTKIVWSNVGGDGNETCAICTAEMKDGMVIYDIVCEHVFHCACLRDWVASNDSCPVCRCIGIFGTLKTPRTSGRNPIRTVSQRRSQRVMGTGGNVGVLPEAVRRRFEAQLSAYATTGESRMHRGRPTNSLRGTGGDVIVPDDPLSPPQRGAGRSSRYIEDVIRSRMLEDQFRLTLAAMRSEDYTIHPIESIVLPTKVELHPSTKRSSRKDWAETAKKRRN